MEQYPIKTDTLVTGSYVTVKLGCGHELEILVYEDHLFIKTNTDDLEVDQISEFGVKIKQVPRGYSDK